MQSVVTIYYKIIADGRSFLNNVAAGNFCYKIVPNGTIFNTNVAESMIFAKIHIDEDFL